MGVVQGLTGLAGAGITAASNTAATIATNKANKQIAQMNNEFNEKMLQKQMDYNTEMYQQQLGDQWKFYDDAKQNQWDMFNATNEYNSASAQRERLEAAGLNPYLMMSGGSAGTAQSSSGPSGSAPSAQGVTPPTATPYHADYSGIAQGFGQAIDAYNQIEMSKAQRGKISAEENNLRIEGKYKAAQIIAQLDNLKQNTKSQAAKTAIDQMIAGAQKDLMAAQVDKVKGETAYNAILARGATINNMLQSEQLKYLPQQLRNSIAQQTADIAVKYAQRDLTKKQVEHEIEKIANTIVSRDYIREQTNAQAVSTNGQLQQQSEFADTYKIRRNILVAEMRKSIFDVNPFGHDRLGRMFNSVYHMADPLRTWLNGGDDYFESYK